MASVESGQLVWGPYRQCVRQWGRQREKKTLLSCQRMIFPWGLEQRRPTEIWRRCSNLIPSGGKKTPPQKNERLVQTESDQGLQHLLPRRSCLGLLLSRFPLTRPSPFLTHPSGLQCVVANRCPNPLLSYVLFALCLSPSFPFPLGRATPKVKFCVDVDRF